MTIVTARTDTADGYTLRTYATETDAHPYLVERHWRDDVAEHHEVTLLDGKGNPLSTSTASVARG